MTCEGCGETKLLIVRNTGLCASCSDVTRLRAELAQAQERIRELERQLAEARSAAHEFANGAQAKLAAKDEQIAALTAERDRLREGMR